jgi:hypothetical protein
VINSSKFEVGLKMNFNYDVIIHKKGKKGGIGSAKKEKVVFSAD